MSSKRLQIARECLRMVWQIHDAGGISLGRSQESMWLELAMDLIDSDLRYSKLADTDRAQFLAIAKDESHRVRNRKMKAHYKRLDDRNAAPSEGRTP